MWGLNIPWGGGDRGWGPFQRHTIPGQVLFNSLIPNPSFILAYDISPGRGGLNIHWGGGDGDPFNGHTIPGLVLF